MTAWEDWQSQIPIQQSAVFCAVLYRVSQRTVTSNDQELVVVTELVDGDIGESGNNLLLWWKVCALLELKVANGTAQGEVAIDSAKVDEAASRTDACLFALVLRFVVK